MLPYQDFRASKLSLLVVSLIFLASIGMARELHATEVKPEHLDDNAIATVILDIRTLKWDSLVTGLGKQGEKNSFNKTQLKTLSSMIQAVVDQLKAAEVRDIAIVFSMNDLKRRTPYLVIPNGTSAGAEKVEKIINSLSWMTNNGLFETCFRDGTTVYCGPDDLKQRVPNPATAQSERMFQFEIGPRVSQSTVLGSASLVIALTKDQRRILREMIPEDSQLFGDMNSGQFASINWVSLPLSPSSSDTILSLGISDTNFAKQIAKQLPKLIAKTGEHFFHVKIHSGEPKVRTGADNTIFISIDISAINTTDSLLAVATRKMLQSAFRQNIVKNLKQIALGMHNFHDRYGSFPPPASYDKKGQPLLSWRVYLLPFLDEGKLYREFHLDEPWDSDHNKKLIHKMPAVFASEHLDLRMQGKTTLIVPIDEQSVFSGKTGIPIKEITDGTTATLMVMNAPREHAVTWTKPDDLKVDKGNLHDQLFGGRKEFWIATCDGAAHKLSSTINLKTLKALVTRNGGEIIESF